METYEQDAEVVGDMMPMPTGAEGIPDGYQMEEGGGGQDNDMFQRQNDLRVIQEYNREENLPKDLKDKYWALNSKSLKLGFWNKDDEILVYLFKNNISVGDIMSKPKHKYTFKERQQMNQMSFLVYADFKRGVGMERHKINERTLQSMMITQSIQGGGNSAKKAGALGFLKNIFG